MIERKTKTARAARAAAPAAPPALARRWIVSGALARTTHLILAHGAGAGMESPMLDSLARMLDARDVTVHRFEFPFMAARSLGLSRRPAPRAETLIADYEDAIAEVRARIGERSRLFAGGKSMGGRVACLAAGACDAVAGVVVIGFPLCPPRKPHTSRARALDTLERPALIVQGTRDPFGGRAEFEVLALPAHISFHWIDDGDHDLKPRRMTGSTHDDALNEAADAIAQFCTGGR